MQNPDATQPHDTPRRRGAVAIIKRDDRLLVIRRSAHVVAPGAFCFPGGGVDGDETDQQALVRELDEELGVAVQPICQVWHSVTPWHVELTWWLADIGQEAVPIPNPREVESIHWYTTEEMLALDELLESNREFLRALALGEILLE